MTLLLKQLFAFFKLLNSDTGLNSLAAGLSLGLILGFSPFVSLQTLIVFIIIFFFRVQMGAAFLSAFFFKLVAWMIDPLADILGRHFLETEALRPMFVSLYNMPLVPLTRFNNSIVAGSGLIGFMLVIPAFFVFRVLIQKYRATVVAHFKETRLWKLWAGTKFYNWYTTYEKLYL